MTVLVAEPVFPRVGPQDLFLLLPGLAVPGERDDARVGHAGHRDRLGALEGLEHVDRHPGMLVDDLLLDAEHMHDREDAGLLVVGDLLVLEIREQPADARILGGEGLDDAGMDHRIELALGQHGLDRFRVRQPRDLQVGMRRELDVLVELGEIFD